MTMLDELGPLASANPGWLVVLAPFAVLAYFAPFLIAFERRHRFLWTIGVINLAAGWTILGWIATLVWAVNKDVKSLLDELPTLAPDSPLEPQWSLSTQSDSPLVGGQLKACPYCAEHIRAEAIVCRYCHRDLAPSAEFAPVTDLNEQEKRRLQSLLTDDATGNRQDPNLLDVFEYARLLEAEESAAILARVGVANLPIQAPPPRKQDESAPHPVRPIRDQVEVSVSEESDSDWMLNAPVAGQGR